MAGQTAVTSSKWTVAMAAQTAVTSSKCSIPLVARPAYPSILLSLCKMSVVLSLNVLKAVSDIMEHVCYNSVTTLQFIETVNSELDVRVQYGRNTELLHWWIRSGLTF